MAFKSYDPNYTGKQYPTGYGAYGEPRAKKSTYAQGFSVPVAPASAEATAPAPAPVVHQTSDQLRGPTPGIYQTPGSQRNVGYERVSRIEFDPDAVTPELNVPKFKAPKFNRRAVRATTQKLAAPGVRRLRDVIQAAASRNFENPNVRRMTLRQALAGYGQGLESVMAGSHQQAQAEEMQAHQLKYGEAMTNYEAQLASAMRAYDNAWKKYLAGAKETTTVKDVTEPTTARTGGQPVDNIWRPGKTLQSV